MSKLRPKGRAAAQATIEIHEAEVQDLVGKSLSGVVVGQGRASDMPRFSCAVELEHPLQLRGGRCSRIAVVPRYWRRGPWAARLVPIHVIVIPLRDGGDADGADTRLAAAQGLLRLARR